MIILMLTPASFKKSNGGLSSISYESLHRGKTETKHSIEKHSLSQPKQARVMKDGDSPFFLSPPSMVHVFFHLLFFLHQ